VFTLQDAAFLTSPLGSDTLAALATEDLSDSRTLALLTRLRRNLTGTEAGEALEQARLRQKAAEKFGADAERMLFTRPALEQASHPLVRRYRAARFAGLRVVDACCGIGSDALALAAAGAQVMGLDLDEVRVVLARHNAAVCGLSAQFEVGDVTGDLPPAEAVFFDPARRDAQGNRIHHVERYQPPLAALRGWSQPLVAAKLSPGVDLEQIESYGGGVEFISVAGDLKEALLWRGAGWEGRRAVLLEGDSAHVWTREGAEPPALLDVPRHWLIEPDPALLRAGLVRDAAAAWGAAFLDDTIAYLTADQPPQTAWARSWRILAALPFNVKQLRALLRESDVGTVTVKKRGSPITPETLIPQLKLKGTQSRTVVLCRLRGQPYTLVCEEHPVARG
jgi:SAM-dependent methyltransferase